MKERSAAAIAWIQRAHLAAADGGISKGYDLLRRRWAPSYPETTGYTIPTLLNAAKALEKPELITMAISLAEYLLKKTSGDGGVVYWQAEASTPPIVFDTGQVMFGWLAAYRASRDERFFKGCYTKRELVSSYPGSVRVLETNQHLNVVKVIDYPCRMGITRVVSNQPGMISTARQQSITWSGQANSRMNPVGTTKCSFLVGRDPYTHTLA